MILRDWYVFKNQIFQSCKIPQICGLWPHDCMLFSLFLPRRCWPHSMSRMGDIHLMIFLCQSAVTCKDSAEEEKDRVSSADFPTMAWHYGESEVSAKAPFLLKGAGMPRDKGKRLGMGMEGTGSVSCLATEGYEYGNVASSFSSPEEGRGSRSWLIFAPTPCYVHQEVQGPFEWVIYN